MTQFAGGSSGSETGCILTQTENQILNVVHKLYYKTYFLDINLESINTDVIIALAKLISTCWHHSNRVYNKQQCFSSQRRWRSLLSCSHDKGICRNWFTKGAVIRKSAQIKRNQLTDIFPQFSPCYVPISWQVNNAGTVMGF